MLTISLQERFTKFSNDLLRYEKAANDTFSLVDKDINKSLMKHAYREIDYILDQYNKGGF